MVQQTKDTEDLLEEGTNWKSGKTGTGNNKPEKNDHERWTY